MNNLQWIYEHDEGFRAWVCVSTAVVGRVDPADADVWLMSEHDCPEGSPQPPAPAGVIAELRRAVDRIAAERDALGRDLADVMGRAGAADSLAAIAAELREAAEAGCSDETLDDLAGRIERIAGGAL